VTKYRRTRSVATAALLIAGVAYPGTAFGHTPVAGAVAEYAKNSTLSYYYAAGGYPSWVTTATNGTLTVNWPSSTDNNSASPQFVLGSSGGVVTYIAQAASPCSGNTGWLACSSNWGTTSFHIYIRDLGGAPNGNWAWYDPAASCPPSSTCFYARRSLIHETEHVALGVAGHDGQGETNTVMGKNQPSASSTGWNTTTTRRCDEAAAQLKYDTRTSSGPYADCFDHIVDHGSVGLVSVATVSASSYLACNGTFATATGRLAIKADSYYEQLTDNPLTSRTVYFDRRPVGGTWTLNVTSTTASSAPGYNWSKSWTSSNITYQFRAHYSGETGVDPSNQPTFTITWSNPC
jgi:hypothetical protein